MYNRRHPILGTGLGLLIATMAACGGDDPEPQGVTDQSGSGGSAGIEVTTTETELGTILVDDEGRTLYMFTRDSPGTVCECESGNWLPLEGDVTAGEGVVEGLVGSTERGDGTTQPTYADWPLYYFGQDAEPGDLTGQGANDVWFVLSAEGEVIEEALSPGSSGGFDY